MTTPTPVLVDGVTYASITEAAAELGVSKQALSARLARADRGPVRKGRPPKSVRLDGIMATIPEHAARLKLPVAAIYRRIAKLKAKRGARKDKK